MALLWRTQKWWAWVELFTLSAATAYENLDLGGSHPVGPRLTYNLALANARPDPDFRYFSNCQRSVFITEHDISLDAPRSILAGMSYRT